MEKWKCVDKTEYCACLITLDNILFLSRKLGLTIESYRGDTQTWINYKGKYYYAGAAVIVYREPDYKQIDIFENECEFSKYFNIIK